MIQTVSTSFTSGQILTAAALDSAFALASGPQAIQMSRLKAALAGASSGNPYVRTELIPAVAWAINTAYLQGQVVSANGNRYVCIVSGTSATTGIGPSGVLSAAIVDGTINWTYHGANLVTTADLTAPAVTSATTNPGYGTAYNYGANMPLFAIRGCYPTINPNLTTACGMYGFNMGGGFSGTNSYQVAGRRVDFFSDTAEIVLHFYLYTGTSYWRVAVDQFDGQGLRFVQFGGFPVNAAVGRDTYITLGFSSAKRRRYVLFASNYYADNFVGVQIDTTASVWAPGKGADLTAVVISDSTTGGEAGAGPFLAGNDVCNRLAFLLGMQNVWSFSTGGTGEIATGGGSITYFNFGQRIAEALTLNPDLWIIAGSINDAGAPAATLEAAVVSTMQAVRAGGNTSPIVRMGAWPLSNSTTPALCEANLLTGYNTFAASDSYAHGWVALASGTPPIITRTANNNNGQYGENDTIYLAGSGHPTDWGTVHEVDFYVEGISRIYSNY